VWLSGECVLGCVGDFCVSSEGAGRVFYLGRELCRPGRKWLGGAGGGVLWAMSMEVS
jgi:hypothetical protein